MGTFAWGLGASACFRCASTTSWFDHGVEQLATSGGMDSGEYGLVYSQACLDSISAHCRDTALHLASWSGHTGSVKALLEKGAAVNAKNINKCAFLCLLYWTDVDCLCRQRLCGRFGSWVSVSAPCRRTALHRASSNGHTEIVTALLEKGADVNAEDNSKCAFLCLLYWMGDGCPRRQRLFCA
jgi:hypothetical protein